MANTIKLKRGSGSNPGTSDLSVGEVALRTDNGTLFTKTDAGQVSEIGASSGVADGDKGDITVSNSGISWTIDAGAIDNANISSSAAIAGTKISPDFGSQDIATTGKLSITSTFPRIDLTDSNNNPDWSIINNNGILGFYDDTNSAYRLNIQADGHVDVGHLDVGNALDVTGAITSTGNLTITNTAPLITFNDSDNENDFVIGNVNGTFIIQDSDAAVNRFTVATGGQTTISGNLDLGAGLDVTGNITATGTLSAGQTTLSHSTAPQLILKDSDTSGVGDVNGISLQDSGGTEYGFIGQTETGGHSLFIKTVNTTNPIRLQVNSSTILEIGNTGAYVTGLLNVTGNIGVSGTVDGVDIAARNTLFGGLTSSSGVLTNGVTATTQSASDNSTKVATTAYTDTAISNLIDSSPGTLNTLNELAAALGDDANFSTTVTNSIATKLPLAGGTLTGNISGIGFLTQSNVNSTGDSGLSIKNGSRLGFDQSGTRSWTVKAASGNLVVASGDGSGALVAALFSGSGASLTNVNATTLDSIDSGSFLRSDADDTMSGVLSLTSSSQYPLTINGSNDGKIVLRGSSNPYITFRESNTDKGYLQWHSDGYLKIKNHEDGSSIRIKDTIDFSTDDSTWHTVWNASNDGAGSGLDADTLDGVQGASYLRSDAEDSSSAPLNINGGTANGANDATLYVTAPNNNDWGLKVNKYNNSATDYGARIDVASGAAHALTIYGNSSEVFRIRGTGTVTAGGSNTVWHAGNDGSGSGLDADTLDGVQGASYLRSDADDEIAAKLTVRDDDGLVVRSATNAVGAKINFSDQISDWGQNGTLTYKHVDGAISTTGGNSNDGWLFSGSETRTVVKVAGVLEATTNIYSNGGTVWHTNNDGSGSGLDADTLDGVQGSSFLRSDAADSATGTLTVRDVKLSAGYHLQRSDHHSGHLEGSYNNVAANDSRSNPIYSIGSNYNPTDSGLSNMYGIGYTHTNASFISFTGASGWGMYVAADGDARIYLDGSNGVISSNGQHYVGSSVVWNAGNDGSGSGLDADTVDNIQGSSLVRSDASDTLTGATYTFSSATAQKLILSGSSNPYIRLQEGTTNKAYWQFHSNGNVYLWNQESSRGIRFASDMEWYNGSAYVKNWHQSNDGSGSGLDADTLDGAQGSSYMRTDSTHGYLNGSSTTHSTLTLKKSASGADSVDYLQLRNNANSLKLVINGDGDISPGTSGASDLGSSSKRWGNIYTSDLHCSNEGGANSVDGTWGDWTLQEGDENIFMINNRTGKKYRMGLTEVT